MDASKPQQTDRRRKPQTAVREACFMDYYDAEGKTTITLDSDTFSLLKTIIGDKVPEMRRQVSQAGGNPSGKIQSMRRLLSTFGFVDSHLHRARG